MFFNAFEFFHNFLIFCKISYIIQNWIQLLNMIWNLVTNAYAKFVMVRPYFNILKSNLQILKIGKDVWDEHSQPKI